MYDIVVDLADSNRYGSDPLEPNKQSGKDNSCENN